MECSEARLLIEAGVIPGSGPGRRADLGFHLAGCAACRAFRATVVPPAARIAKAASVVAAPAPPELVVQPEVKLVPRRRGRWLLPAVVLVLLLAALWYWGVPLVRAWGNVGAMTMSSGGGGVTRPQAPPPATATEQRLVAASIRATPTSRAAAPTATAATPRTTTPSVRPAPTTTSMPTATAAPSPTATPPAGMTVLIMGIDARPSEGMLARTDSMILARLDPRRHVVSLMSLPRDLWVSIPGGIEGKINSAFYVGEAAAAGGGPALARQTVSTLLGIPIDGHVVVDFRGFRSLIDTVGGITIDVPKELYDPQYPTEDYGYMTAHFLSGLQHMNGDQALMYSRIRHPDSDFQRMRRQQQVILAVTDALRQQGAATTLHRADELTAALAGFVHTDLAPATAVSVLWGLRDMQPAQVRQIAVDTDYLTQTNIGGAYALIGTPQLFQHLGSAFLNGTQP